MRRRKQKPTWKQKRDSRSKPLTMDRLGSRGVRQRRGWRFVGNLRGKRRRGRRFVVQSWEGDPDDGRKTIGEKESRVARTFVDKLAKKLDLSLSIYCLTPQYYYAAKIETWVTRAAYSFFLNQRAEGTSRDLWGERCDSCAYSKRIFVDTARRDVYWKSTRRC